MLPVLAQVETVEVSPQLFWFALAGAVVPCLAWLVFFYTRDRYEREPKRLIAKLFLVGALPVAIAAGIINGIADELLGAVLGGAGIIVVIVIVAPFGEETLKYLGTSRFSRRNPAFNEPVDGMIYGSTVGLGFAAAETTDYLILAYLGVDPFGAPLPDCPPGLECFLQVALIRGLGTALLHALCTGIAGYFLAQRVLAGAPRGRAVGGVLLAALLHAFWNGSPIGLVWLAIGVPAIIYWRLLRKAIKASPFHGYQVFGEHFGLVPPPPPPTRRP